MGVGTNIYLVVDRKGNNRKERMKNVKTPCWYIYEDLSRWLLSVEKIFQVKLDICVTSTYLCYFVCIYVGFKRSQLNIRATVRAHSRVHVHYACRESRWCAAQHNSTTTKYPNFDNFFGRKNGSRQGHHIFAINALKQNCTLACNCEHRTLRPTPRNTFSIILSTQWI